MLISTRRKPIPFPRALILRDKLLCILSLRLSAATSILPYSLKGVEQLLIVSTTGNMLFVCMIHNSWKHKERPPQFHYKYIFIEGQSHFRGIHCKVIFSRKRNTRKIWCSTSLHDETEWASYSSHMILCLVNCNPIDHLVLRPQPRWLSFLKSITGALGIAAVLHKRLACVHISRKDGRLLYIK